MDENMKQQIRLKMQSYDTDELLEIWHKNDRAAWSDEAFEITREILIERLGTLPAQPDPIPPHLESLNDDDETDTYYNVNRMFNISLMALRLSWLFPIWGVASVVVSLINYYENLAAVNATPFTNFTNILPLISAVLNQLLILLISLFLFLLTRGIAEGLYLLMDIEDNTRRAANGER